MKKITLWSFAAIAVGTILSLMAFKAAPLAPIQPYILVIMPAWVNPEQVDSI